MIQQLTVAVHCSIITFLYEQLFLQQLQKYALVSGAKGRWSM